MTTIQYYCGLLGELPVNKKGGRRAPHKAVLLLAIIGMVERGEISSPFIPLSEALQSNFIAVWREYVPQTWRFDPRMSYPFFHLASSPFWELVKAPGHVGRKEYSSLVSLQRDFAGAFIDVGLFRLMKHPESREALRQVLLSTYLSDSASGSTGSRPALMLTALISIICACA